VIITPHLPKVFNLGTRRTTPGKHGFDNHHPEMRATFIAWGPAFRKGITIDGFENVHIYPLVAHILGLPIDEKMIDGNFKVLAPILKNK
jgi:predicted AlkP superfamily pyrophosphatase or phosphodiesterase